MPHMWRDGPGFGVYMLIYEGYGVFTLITPYSGAELLPSFAYFSAKNSLQVRYVVFVLYFYFIVKIFKRARVQGKVNQRQSSCYSKKSNYSGQKESVNATSLSRRLTTTFRVVFYNILPAVEICSKDAKFDRACWSPWVAGSR